jgi:hypothetical protein
MNSTTNAIMTWKKEANIALNIKIRSVAVAANKLLTDVLTAVNLSVVSHYAMIALDITKKMFIAYGGLLGMTIVNVTQR